jgi:hypothetical protein
MSRQLLPYKFQIVAVCQAVEDGKVVGEQTVSQANGQPLVVYGVDGLRKFANEFEENLRQAEPPSDIGAG